MPIFVFSVLMIIAASASASSMVRVTCEERDHGAHVYVNDSFKGECPIDISVQEGAAKIRIIKTVDEDHERVFSQELQIGDGVVKKIQAALISQLTARAVAKEQERISKIEAEWLRLREQGVYPGSGQSFKDCLGCPEMVMIPAADSFQMGGISTDEINRYSEAFGLMKHSHGHPVHNVHIPRAFALGRTEVTREQFAAFVVDAKYEPTQICTGIGGLWGFGIAAPSNGYNWLKTGFSQGGDHPVTCISYDDINAYLLWLSKKTGKKYYLPSEAEWEYACVAGKRMKYCGADEADFVAWHEGNSKEATHPVATKQGNAWGLFDMSGNIDELTEDTFHSDYYGAPADGSSWKGNGNVRVLRGGSWRTPVVGTMSIFRAPTSQGLPHNTVGFRVARELP